MGIILRQPYSGAPQIIRDDMQQTFFFPLKVFDKHTVKNFSKKDNPQSVTINWVHNTYCSVQPAMRVLSAALCTSVCIEYNVADASVKSHPIIFRLHRKKSMFSRSKYPNTRCSTLKFYLLAVCSFAFHAKHALTQHHLCAVDYTGANNLSDSLPDSYCSRFACYRTASPPPSPGPAQVPNA